MPESKPWTGKAIKRWIRFLVGVEKSREGFAPRMRWVRQMYYVGAYEKGGVE